METLPGEVADIGDIADRLEAAFNVGDAVALASLYSETATLMPPNEPMVSGRAGIQAWFERVLPRLGTVSVVPLESSAVGDHGFQVGTFTSTDAGSASTPGTPAVRVGKYALVLTRATGGWKIQYDIWSLDQPALN